MDIVGAVAVVTGGGSGLGAGTARVLHAAGARVAVLDLSLERAQAVAAELDGLALACDVADEASARQALETRFRDLERDSQVDDELEALKRRMSQSDQSGG